MTDGAVTADKHKDMVKLIQSMSGGLLDADPTNFKANSQFIATGKANSSQVLSRDEAAVKLQEYEDKFLALWDEDTSTYLKHSEHTPSKQMPTQYLALQQLKKRWENPTPLLVAVPAPAGYGKTQLILAWLAYLRSTPDQPQWAVLAITGVAASNSVRHIEKMYWDKGKQSMSLATIPCGKKTTKKQTSNAQQACKPHEFFSYAPARNTGCAL